MYTAILWWFDSGKNRETILTTSSFFSKKECRKEKEKKNPVLLQSFFVRANRALDNCKEGFVFMESVRELRQAGKSVPVKGLIFFQARVLN